MKFIHWIIIAVALQPILYWKSFDAEFVFDDRFLIVYNETLSSLGAIWLGDLWAGDQSSSGFYRPIFLMSVALDKELFGADPIGYHVHNVFWHSVNVFLFGMLVRRQLTRSIALTALGIFAFHSMLSEGVYWISARNDTLCTTFLLLTLLQFLRDRPRILLGTFCFGLALLSKESALCLPICLLFLCTKERKKIVIATATMVVTILLWRLLLGIVNNLSTLDRWTDVLWQFPMIIADYASHILWPWPLSPARPVAWLHLEWWNWALAFICLGLLFKSVYASPRALMGWLLLALGSFLPVIVPIVYTGIYGDRYLYLPMVPLAIILASTEFHIVFRMCIPLWMFLSVVKGTDWQDDMSFWEAEVRNTPSPFSQVSLAHIKYNNFQYNQAFQLYKEGFSAETPYLDGCDVFLASVLKTRGAEAVVQYGQWSLQRGCPETGALLGVLAVGHAVLWQWEEVEIILKKQKEDPYKRLQVVEVSFALYNGNTIEYCRIWDSWDDTTNLERQIQVILPDHRMIDCNENQ